jgi:hypothetical protein
MLALSARISRRLFAWTEVSRHSSSSPTRRSAAPPAGLTLWEGCRDDVDQYEKDIGIRNVHGRVARFVRQPDGRYIELSGASLVIDDRKPRRRFNPSLNRKIICLGSGCQLNGVKSCVTVVPDPIPDHDTPLRSLGTTANAATRNSQGSNAASWISTRREALLPIVLVNATASAHRLSTAAIALVSG